MSEPTIISVQSTAEPTVISVQATPAPAVISVQTPGPSGPPGPAGDSQVFFGTDFPPDTPAPALLIKFTSGGVFSDFVVREPNA